MTPHSAGRSIVLSSFFRLDILALFHVAFSHRLRGVASSHEPISHIPRLTANGAIDSIYPSVHCVAQVLIIKWSFQRIRASKKEQCPERYIPVIFVSHALCPRGACPQSRSMPGWRCNSQCATKIDCNELTTEETNATKKTLASLGAISGIE